MKGGYEIMCRDLWLKGVNYIGILDLARHIFIFFDIRQMALFHKRGIATSENKKFPIMVGSLSARVTVFSFKK